MPSIAGHVDGFEGCYLSGWAIADPDVESCRIEVTDEDGHIVGRGRATRVRPDLKELGRGRVNFGFRFPVQLDHGGLLRVSAHGVELGGSPVLSGPGTWDGVLVISKGVAHGSVTERTSKLNEPPVVHIRDQYGKVVAEAAGALETSRDDANFVPWRFEAALGQECFGRGEIQFTASINGYNFAQARCDLPLKGILDSISPTRCAGWLLSPEAPDREFQIEVLVNGDPVVIATAAHPRDDLRHDYPRSWRKGFDIPLSLELPMDQLSEVSVRLVGSNIDLFDGPFVMGHRVAVIGAARNAARLSHLATHGLNVGDRSILQNALAGFISKHRSGDDQVVLRSVGHGPQRLNDRRLNIIIPVYRDVGLTRECIASVLRHRNPFLDSVVLINDCSPEADMHGMLREFTKGPHVFLLTNETNLGFVQSANLGLRFCPYGDVVLLNSDTRVFDGGLDELWRVAYSSADIGSVTALSNNATIFTYPHPSRPGPVLEDVDWEEISAVALRDNAGVVVDVPTGHGFCLLVKAEVLQRVGRLDEEYGRGYGEENDLCNRAADLGFRNVAAAGAFVEHREGVSFGSERSTLWDRNRVRLESSFPDYTPAVMEYERRDGLRKARWALDVFRLNKARIGGQSFILTIENYFDGGTKTAAKDLDAAFGGTTTTLSSLRLSVRKDGSMELAAQAPWMLAVFAEDEARQLFDVLTAASIEAVIIHQLLGFSRTFLELLPEWIKTRPSILFLHDFYSFCPRVNLIDAVGRFCDIPHIDVCERCVVVGGTHEGSRVDELAVTAHRELFAEIFTAVRRLVAPSENARRYFARVFSDTEIRVMPHAQSLWEFPATPRTGSANEIVVLGAIGRHKGSGSLLEIARAARLTNPQFRFHVIGYTDIDSELLAVGNVTITGPYEAEDVGRLIDRTGGRIALFLHGWPETFSYTLSEAVAAGLIPLVPDIGAPAERVRAAKFGVVFPFPFDAGQVLGVIEAVADGRVEPYADGVGPAAFHAGPEVIKETRGLLLDMIEPLAVRRGKKRRAGGAATSPRRLPATPRRRNGGGLADMETA